MLGKIFAFKKIKNLFKAVNDNIKKQDEENQKNNLESDKANQEWKRIYSCKDDDENKELNTKTILSIATETWNKIYSTYKKYEKRDNFYCIEKDTKGVSLYNKIRIRSNTESYMSYEIDDKGNLLLESMFRKKIEI